VLKARYIKTHIVYLHYALITAQFDNALKQLHYSEIFYQLTMKLTTALAALSATVVLAAPAMEMTINKRATTSV
jgi:hypothetical protein